MASCIYQQNDVDVTHGRILTKSTTSVPCLQLALVDSTAPRGLSRGLDTSLLAFLWCTGTTTRCCALFTHYGILAFTT